MWWVWGDVFGLDVVNDFDGFGSGEERDACAVAKEAEVAVVCHDVDGCVPGYLRHAGSAWAGVIDRADVAAAESDAGACSEHSSVGGICGG